MLWSLRGVSSLLGGATLPSPEYPRLALRPGQHRLVPNGGIIARVKGSYPVSRWLMLGVALMLAACTAEVRPLFTPSPSPLPTATASPTPAPRPTATPTRPLRSPTPLPSPTPTPRTHVVQRGEDLFGIALRYGVSLEALLAANPTVTPQFLSVGTQLRIPAAVPTPDPNNPPTPTPIGLRLDAPVCTPSADGGLWCFAWVHNPQSFAVEGVTAQFRRLDAASGAIQAQTVASLLNRLPAGEALPLAAFFPPPLPQAYQVDAEVLTALPVPKDTPRYLDAWVEDLHVTIHPNGLGATLEGHLLLAPEVTQPAQQVWVLGVAVDAAGQVVGVRRWDSASPLAPGERLPFRLRVYSAGPPIARAEVRVEARP